MSDTPLYQQGMLAPNSLNGLNIIITGGGTGLGKSVAKYCIGLGAKVAIASRKTEVINATVKELENDGEIIGITCDVRDYKQVEAMIETCLNTWSSVNGLLNNAAGNFISPTERLTHKAFDVITDIVMRGTYNCTLALGKYWIEQKIPASVLNICTTYAWTGSGYVVPSAMAKAGVLAMTRSLAVEWAKYNIRCNAIAPGPFPTEGAWQRLFPQGLEQIYNPIDKIPLKRFGHHQELCNLAAYLLSDFSAFINGEIVTIDGGEWLKGAGEFNDLDKIPDAMWDILEKTIRNKK